MHVVGTAGHVDHGKSALVRALTGVDPDRWAEEQQRGMTLDLGFAHLRFPDGIEAGIVDVPGHERFLHNMLAGAAGMEIVLLVVAANEGPRQQTLEHLSILRYLGVRSTLIVLNKIDTIAAAERAQVAASVKAALRDTIAGDAALYPVSTLTSEGLAALRDAIHATLAALPERNPHAPPYLPIDRVFALSGHGTIVTGTLMQGQIALGDTLELTPAGRAVRVRGLHVFGTKRDFVRGGSRVALNLPGIDTAAIARGAVLAAPEFVPSAQLRVEFRALPGALALIRRRMPVRAYIGAAEILGTLVLDELPRAGAGTTGALHLRMATVAIPGASFVVRRVSPMDVLGGGTIASTLADAGPGEPPIGQDTSALLLALERCAIGGATAAQLAATLNLSVQRVTQRLVELAAAGDVLTVAKPTAYVTRSVAQATLARVREVLAQRQATRPWRLGTTSLALAQAAELPEAALMRVLAPFVDDASLVYRNGYYATTGFAPRLSAEQREYFERALSGAQAEAPGSPVALEALLALVKTSGRAELSDALETLLATGALVKVGPFVYRANYIAGIRARLESALANGASMTVAQFRDLSGTSRKYAVPLLEFFDATGVTLRSGDLRVLRRPPVRKPA